MVMYAFSIDIMLCSCYYKFSTLNNTYFCPTEFSAYTLTKPKSKYQQYFIPFWGSRKNPFPGPFRLLVEFDPMLVRPRSLIPCWISRIPSQLLDTTYIHWPISPNNFKVSSDRLSLFFALCLSCLFSTSLLPLCISAWEASLLLQIHGLLTRLYWNSPTLISINLIPSAKPILP